MTYVCISRVIQAPNYSIVKESSADLEVKFRIVHVSALHKTKYFFAYLAIILYIWEKIKPLMIMGHFWTFNVPTVKYALLSSDS